MYNLSIKFACLILAATLTLAGCGSSSSSDDTPTPTPPVTNPPGDDDNGGDDNDDDNGDDEPDEPAEPVIISFDFVNGIDGWYLNGEGPGVTSSENIEISHDASASAMVIEPFDWTAETWLLEPRAEIESTDLSGATLTFVVDVPEAYVTDGGLRLQISAGGEYLGWLEIEAGENALTATAPAAVGTTTHFGIQLAVPPNDEAIKEPILVTSVTIELAVQEDVEVVPPAVLDFDHLHALVEFPIGIAVSGPGEHDNLLRDNAAGEAERVVVEQHFNQLTAGNIMKMNYLHREWGEYDYSNADQLVDYADDNDMTMHGHALVWHSCYQVPDWVKNFNDDPSTFLRQLATHTETIAAHYAGRVESWDVVNEAFQDNGNHRVGAASCENNGEVSLFYHHAGGDDYLETAFVAARAGDPDADLYYNDFNLSDDSNKLAAVLEMAKDFQARSVPINGIGFQMHIHMDWPSTDAIRSSFQKVVDLGLKVKITELDIPYHNPHGGGDPKYPGYTVEFAEAQKKRYCEVVKTYMDTVPEEKRGGLTIWGLTDGSSWLNSTFFNGNQSWPLLFSDDLQPKPAMMGVADALRGKPCS